MWKKNHLLLREKGTCQTKRGTYQIWIGALTKSEEGVIIRKGQKHILQKENNHLLKEKMALIGKEKGAGGKVKGALIRGEKGHF